MQLADVTVRLGGQLTRTVRKHGITPAEGILLKALHGQDAVVEGRLNGSTTASSAVEIERLRQVYGVSAENLRTIDTLFPGHAPKLPDTFEEAGIEAERASAAKSAKAANPAMADILE